MFRWRRCARPARRCWRSDKNTVCRTNITTSTTSSKFEPHSSTISFKIEAVAPKLLQTSDVKTLSPMKTKDLQSSIVASVSEVDLTTVRVAHMLFHTCRYLSNDIRQAGKFDHCAFIHFHSKTGFRKAFNNKWDESATRATCLRDLPMEVVTCTVMVAVFLSSLQNLLCITLTLPPFAWL